MTGDSAAFGATVPVAQRVAERVDCEHASVCAGCPLIEMPYDDQLAAKRERVRGAALPYPELAELSIDPVTPAIPNVGYRVRAKLMVGARPLAGGGPSLGLYARAVQGADDHQLVDIPHCQVLVPSLQEVAARLRALLRSPPAGAGTCLIPEAEGGALSAVDLREVLDDRPLVLVTLVLASVVAPPDHELEEAARAVRELSPLVMGVAVNRRQPGSVQVLGPSTRALSGPSEVRDRAGVGYRLATFGSFTQAHRGQAAQIETWIASRLAETAPEARGRVLDLYGGSGALSLGLARRGAKVTLVESFHGAAECAERASREQGLEGYVVRSGDASAVLNDLAKRGERFDAVITNPPRKGMPPSVRGAIAALRPTLVAYVSCDPETLCRDLDHLARLGYRAETLRPIDMIPLTDQVETVAFLRRAAPRPPSLVYEDDHIFVLDRRAHDPWPLPEPRLAGAVLIAVGSTQASGLAIGCKSRESEAALRKALSGTRASAVHVALIKGIVAREGAVQRRTRYRRVARAAGHSLLRVMVDGDHMGRIENDLSRIGHPIIGDTRRGHAPTNRYFEEKYALDRPFLHCIEVEFDHPTTGARVVARAGGESDGDLAGALPGELTTVLGRLGLVALDVTKGVMVG